MQRGVLHAAVVPIHRHPVIERLPACEFLVVMRVAIAQEVPAGTGPVGHGIRFALGRTTALGAGGVNPLLCAGKRRRAVVRGRVIVDLRQHERQLAFRQRHPAALLAVYERDRFAPVTLAAKHPVAQLVIHLPRADALLLQPGDHLLLGLLHLKAVQEPGVDHPAGFAIGKRFLFHVAACYNLDDRQVERLCKRIVARIVRRHGHDRARAVGHEHIIGNPDRDFPARGRVDGV